jgi:hypothetical protein
MLLASRGSDEMHDFLLGKFTDKYINPEYMGQDKVFLFLFENYYAKGDTAWLNEKQRKFIFDRAYSLMANQLNEPASPLELTDTAGVQYHCTTLKHRLLLLHSGIRIAAIARRRSQDLIPFTKPSGKKNIFLF